MRINHRLAFLADLVLTTIAENLYSLKFKMPNRLFVGWRLGQRKAFQNLSSQERAVGEATPVIRSVDPHLSAKGG